MDKVERLKPRKDETQAPVEACSVDELRHILQCLEQEPLKWQALIRLLMDRVIRRGECCGLKWKDVDFQTSAITVTGDFYYTPRKEIYLDTLKNGKPRIVDVAPAVMAFLRALRSEQADRAISAFVFT